MSPSGSELSIQEYACTICAGRVRRGPRLQVPRSPNSCTASGTARTRRRCVTSTPRTPGTERLRTVLAPCFTLGPRALYRDPGVLVARWNM